MQNLRGWPAFAACFALLVQIWFKHHMFFRRYGLQSGPIIALNAGLLFVVLLYVYPLRFMAWILLGSPSDPARRAALQSNSVESVRELFLAYGIGFTAIFTLFGALYFCAWQSRRALELSLYEQAQTWRLMHTQFLVAAVGGLSIGLTLFLSPQKLAWAGFVYALVGVVEFCCGLWRGAPVGKSRSASGG